MKELNVYDNGTDSLKKEASPLRAITAYCIWYYRIAAQRYKNYVSVIMTLQ